jgi:hypothetical protein
MREYLLVWRALPKLLVGSIFLAEVSLLVFGRSASVSGSEMIMRRLTTYFSGATLLVAVVLASGVAAGLGLFLLQVASAAARTAAKLAVRLVPARRRSGLLPLRELFENPYAIALRRFRERTDFYLQFHELKSSSFSTDALGKIDEIKVHYAAVSSHLLSASYEDVESVNYFGLLGQDRRAYEIVEDEIQALENFVVVLLLVPISLLLVGVRGVVVIISVFAILALSLAILPAIARRKSFLASFLLTAYMDNFTVSEGADVADREGEAYF